MSKMVDLSDLTWEQKEQVLRELFARMNGAKTEKQSEEEAKSKQQKKSKMLMLGDSGSKNENLSKYETDDDEDIDIGKHLTVSAKALANAM